MCAIAITCSVYCSSNCLKVFAQLSSGKGIIWFSSENVLCAYKAAYTSNKTINNWRQLNRLIETNILQAVARLTILAKTNAGNANIQNVPANCSQRNREKLLDLLSASPNCSIGTCNTACAMIKLAI